MHNYIYSILLYFFNNNNLHLTNQLPYAVINHTVYEQLNIFTNNIKRSANNNIQVSLNFPHERAAVISSLSINNATFLTAQPFIVVKVIPNQTLLFLPAEVFDKLIINE